jgi:hypothetical protein
MKVSHDLFLRRQTLIAQIESQRMELNQAYRQMEKPIHYGEQALKGFGFLRRNPWIAMAAPGVTSLLFSGLGMLLRRGKPTVTHERPTHDEIIAALKAEGEEMKAKSKKPLRKYLGYAVKAFQLYRKFRPLIPL